MLIYLAKNNITGKVYVGKTKTSLAKRKNQHKYDMKRKNNKFMENLRQYGWENFVWLELATAVNYKQLKQLERQYIKIYNAELNSLNI